MKNLGIFLPMLVSVDELTILGFSLGGELIGEGTLRFGEIPEEAYLDLSTDLSNGCFDDEEFKALQLQLGFVPASYVSVHMNYTQSAFEKALNVVRKIQERWGGNIDYSAAGGSVDTPFQMPGTLFRKEN